MYKLSIFIQLKLNLRNYVIYNNLWDIWFFCELPRIRAAQKGWSLKRPVPVKVGSLACLLCSSTRSFRRRT